MNKNKNLGFTLAEVLIVIGIIGVVAALTLPNLNHATGDKEDITKVKKAYAMLTEALDRSVAIYGPVETWKIYNMNNSTQTIADKMLEFIKISKDCGYYNRTRDTSCFATTNVKWFYGSDTNASVYGGGGLGSSLGNASGGWGSRTIITSDGMSMLIGWYPSARSPHIVIDIDGPRKGKNQWGYDLFVFTITTSKDQISFGGSVASAYDRSLGTASSQWVIYFDNMDYKYASTSNWRCNNDSNIILDGVTNTSCH